MIVNFFKKKSSGVFKEFATKSFAEAVKIGLSALAVAVTNSSPIGLIVGAGAKGITDKLLSKSSEIDKKIDKLIREPLLSGIKHLHDGLLCNSDNFENQQARDKLLYESHISLTKAWSLMTESIDDSMFILALDSIALAAHSNYEPLAKNTFEKLDFYLSDQTIKVLAIERQAKEIVDRADGIQRFLYSDPHGSKPFGYGEQKLAYKQIRKYANSVEEKSKSARSKLDLLLDLRNFSKQVFEISNLKSQTNAHR